MWISGQKRPVLTPERATRCPRTTEISSFSAVIAELGHAALTAASVVGAILDRACELLCSSLDVEYAKVLHQPGGSDPLVLVAGSGWHDDVQIGYATVPRGSDSQAGFTLEVDEVVVVEDFTREQRFVSPSLLVEHGVMSGMSVPILDVDPRLRRAGGAQPSASPLHGGRDRVLWAGGRCPRRGDSQ